MRDDRTRRATEVSQPPIVVACVAEDLAFMPTARRGAREAIIRPPEGVDGGQRRVTPVVRALGLMASGATCVQRLDGSRDSAIHTKYRISLRSSSMREPRYPLPRVVLTYLKMTTPPAHTVSGATRTRSLVQVPWRNPRRCSFVRPEGSAARAQRNPPRDKGTRSRKTPRPPL
ncbi:unnamed protein product [Prunus brigantina]